MKSNSERLSVFGGNGFIGQHFQKLSSYKTLIIDRNSVESLTSTAIYFIGTVDNYNVFTNPHLDVETNLNKLIAVLEFNRRKFKDFRIIFISTWFVYGRGRVPFNENQACNPKGFYSITKLCAEQLLDSYCETFNLNYSIIRLGNVLGPNNNLSEKRNVFQHMIHSIRDNQEIRIYENGRIVRDFIHINDVIAGIDLVINKGKNKNVYNLSSGNGVNIYELIQQYKKRIGSKSEIKLVDTPIFQKKNNS